MSDSHGAETSQKKIVTYFVARLLSRFLTCLELDLGYCEIAGIGGLLLSRLRLLLFSVQMYRLFRSCNSGHRT
jgi:hypothetical protein